MAKALRYGYSTELTPTLFTELVAYGLKTVQLDTPGRSLGSAKLPDDFRINVHAPHTLNLAKPSAVGMLNGMIRDIGDLNGVVVVHCGQFTKTGDVGITGVHNVLNHPSLLHTKRILLENAAGEGVISNKAKTFEYGRDLNELRAIFEGVDVTHHLGLCIDTQHSFAAGICQWQSTDQVSTFLDEIHASFPSKLQCIHLNGSYKAFGSRVDRHAPLGYVNGDKRDLLWGTNLTGLKFLMTEAIEYQWDVISETSDAHQDLGFIQRLW
jgi:endonuclease IV